MIIIKGRDGLKNLIQTQLENNFLCTVKEKDELFSTIPEALLRVEKCCFEITNKYYWNEKKESQFNPFHSGQYLIFLYFLSHIIWKNGNTLLADKVYYLNKMLNACDLCYSVELPEVFYQEHPVGSVLGRASYSKYLIFQQNCTVGGNKKKYPSLGELVWFFANSMVIGNSKIGNNVFISAGTYIKDEVIPDNMIVFGRSPNLILKSRPKEYFYRMSLFSKHKNLVK